MCVRVHGQRRHIANKLRGWTGRADQFNGRRKLNDNLFQYFVCRALGFWVIIVKLRMWRTLLAEHGSSARTMNFNEKFIERMSGTFATQPAQGKTIRNCLFSVCVCVWAPNEDISRELQKFTSKGNCLQFSPLCWLCIFSRHHPEL